MRLQEEIRKAGGIENLARELIERCTVSQNKRRTDSRAWRTLLATGTMDGKVGRVNLTRNYIDKLASFLYSPSEVRFELSFEADEAKAWGEQGDMASRYVTRNFMRRKCHIAFSQALEIALVESCAFIKLIWTRNGYQPYVIRQQFIGVEREDLDEIEQQEVFTHTFYVTPNQFRRLIGERRDAREIMRKVESSFTTRSAEEAAVDIVPGSYIHEVVVGGTSPIGQITGTGSTGNAGVFGPPVPTLAPEVAEHLIQVTDIWVVNDDAHGGDGDWATIRYVDPNIVIEGDMILRNLGDVPHENPFLKVSPNEQPGYFWGMSELVNVYENQRWYERRVTNVDDIYALRARPPRSFIGFSGLTEEKMRALLSRGGVFTDDSVTGKIQSHAPEMPPESLEYLKFIHASFDEAGGMSSIMSGQGEPGVRAGVHANTLLRTSTPRLRDKATMVESQVADFGDLCYRMSRAKDARVFTTDGGVEFMLSQLPDDDQISVDSHTSSPAFSADNMQLAFALARAEAIDGEALLVLTQPPHVDRWIQQYRERQKAKQALIAQHPELLEEHGKGGKKK